MHTFRMFITVEVDFNSDITVFFRVCRLIMLLIYVDLSLVSTLAHFSLSCHVCSCLVKLHEQLLSGAKICAGIGQVLLGIQEV